MKFKEGDQVAVVKVLKESSVGKHKFMNKVYTITRVWGWEDKDPYPYKLSNSTSMWWSEDEIDFPIQQKLELLDE